MKNVPKIKAVFGIAVLCFALVGWDSIARNKVSATIPAVNALVSSDNSGNAGNAHSDIVAVDQDGGLVAFSSSATNLVSGDTNAKSDIFVRDTVNGVTTRVSVSSTGTQGDDDSTAPRISANGRYVVFETLATNIAPTGNSHTQIMIHDMQTGSTEVVSQTAGGTFGDSASYQPDVSRDGRYVAFASAADNLVSGDTNAKHDIFVKDMDTNVITRVSLSTTGAEADNWSYEPQLSCDGAYVAFSSDADNLVSGDTNGKHDIFLVNRLDPNDIQDITIGGDNTSNDPAISCDGSTVSYVSLATNLVASDTNASWDIFTYDVSSGVTTRASLDSTGAETDGAAENGNLSSDGRYVVFESTSGNLVSGDTNHSEDIFLRDRKDGVTERVSLSPTGTQLIANSSVNPAISEDGTSIVYSDAGSNNPVGASYGSSNIFSSESGQTLCSN